MEIQLLDQLETEEGGEVGRFGIEPEGRLHGFHFHDSSVRGPSSHFTDGNTETQRGQDICPEPHS